MFDRILCAIDGSEVTQRVIAATRDLTQKGGGVAVVFHAYHIPEEYLGLAKHFATGPDFLDEVREKLAKEHGPTVEDAARALQRADVTVIIKLQEGKPGPAILVAAEDNDCDCIVVGSHGKGGVSKFLLGSVSDYVVHHAKIPVVVVR